MSEFTYLFRGRKTAGSPEEMQKHSDKWGRVVQGTRRHRSAQGPRPSCWKRPARS
jgi:hypothetical protein